MCAKIAWVWPPSVSYSTHFWLEEKKDSLQHSIEEIAKEHDVLLLIPVKGKSQIIDWKHLYASPQEAIQALTKFNPDIINLNLFGSPFNRGISMMFPKAFITLYDYGGSLICSYSEHVDVFFTFIENRMKTMLQRNRISPEQVIFNPYGADTKRFYPDDSVEKIYTGIKVGDFRRGKRPHLIIKTWGDVDGKLLLVGRIHRPLGDPVYTMECRTLIERLGLSEKVEIRDFVLNDQLPRLINSAEIGIRTSIGGAGGRAATETMACGLPMVVLKNKLNEEWVKSGGIIEVDPESIGVTVNRLKNNPDEYKKLSEAALRTIKPYTYARMLATYRKVFKDAPTKC